MRHSSLSKLFWGLFFIFFKINIYHLDLLTTSLGTLLLVTALWQLSRNGPKLRTAFGFGIVLAVMKAAEVVLFCLGQGSEVNIPLATGYQVMGSLPVALGMSAAGTIGMLCLFYFLFTGLGILAEQEEDTVLAKRLSWCFALYLLTIILSLFAFAIPLLFYLLMFLFIGVFIYILVQVYRFGIAANTDEAFVERRLSPRFFGVLGGALAVALCVSLGALVSRAEPAVSSQAFAPQNGAVQPQAVVLRRQLKALGIPQKVLADLPDGEILRYAGVRNVQPLTQMQMADGGSLSMTQYVADFSSGKVRILDYFQWLTLPRHRYCDSFFIDKNPQVLFLSSDSGVDGFSLYDEKTKNGTVTRKADFLDLEGSKAESAVLGVKYRLLGGRALRQRGFFAYSAQIVDYPNENQEVYTIANYTHQISLFDFDTASQQTQQTGTMGFDTLSNTYAEKKFQLSFNMLIKEKNN